MVPVMPMSIMPMLVMGMAQSPQQPMHGVMVVFPAFAGFAGRTFIQREIIAHADIDFAHSYSLQNAAMLAAPSRSSIYHQKSITIIK
jgi:hypothetical protein